jgi:hypothetical protein
LHGLTALANSNRALQLIWGRTNCQLQLRTWGTIPADRRPPCCFTRCSWEKDHPTNPHTVGVMIKFRLVKETMRPRGLHLLLRSNWMGGKVVVPMVHEMRNPMGLQELFELARSKNIRVIEAEGLGEKSGLRYQKRGVEWIVLNSSMSDNEKVRALGHLLEEDPSAVELDTAKVAEQLGLISLQCPKS